MTARSISLLIFFSKYLFCTHLVEINEKDAFLSIFFLSILTLNYLSYYPNLSIFSAFYLIVPKFYLLNAGEMSQQVERQPILPLLFSSSLISLGLAASSSASSRCLELRSLCYPSFCSAYGTGDSFALLLDPRFDKINFHSAKFYFKRLASFTGLDLPAPTSLIARLISGSWKAHYFLILQGTHNSKFLALSTA